MRCEDALDRMLEAEPAALRGDAGADLALAEHIGSCGRCGAVARALAAELAALDEGLERLAMRAGGGARPVTTARPAGRVRRTAPIWAPLAAAAALAGVLVLGRQGGAPGSGAPGPTGQATPPTGSVEAATVAVTLPADRGGAVIRTANPGITVIWLYERSER
ncbi:MAG TPA: hypothetical protein VMM12_18830 [Longimicrobiales bacterium]|nr:hypothetical protein [Longimicrobiales bacterium]